MKGRPVDQIVYECMFPRPKGNDPQNFQALLQRNLIPEVRHETHAFYGHLDTQEAKYPGLDYTHPTHRIRLSRWQWHRRLFRAFDSLRLTGAEIASLTKWEGTKWAKEKYEREQGVTIRDTTADDFPSWSEIEDAPRASTGRPAFARFVSPPQMNAGEEGEEEEQEEDDDDNDEVDSEDELESVGVELNERLRAQAARREAGDTSAILDHDWEQWLKNAIENGELGHLTDHILQQGTGAATDPAAFLTGNLISARAGQWSEIPEFLRSTLRRALGSEAPDNNESTQQPTERPSGEASGSMPEYLRDPSRYYPMLWSYTPHMTSSESRTAERSGA